MSAGLPYKIELGMVHAGISELRKGFQRHRQGAVTQPQCRNLLLFYAVECGLKAAWLGRNRFRTTAQIDQSLLTRGGHDLMLWTKKLALPALLHRNLSFRLNRDKTGFDVAFAHQAWRYGVALLPSDELALENWLDAVWQWAKTELSL